MILVRNQRGKFDTMPVHQTHNSLQIINENENNFESADTNQNPSRLENKGK
jgi:hypothetical protein